MSKIYKSDFELVGDALGMDLEYRDYIEDINSLICHDITDRTIVVHIQSGESTDTDLGMIMAALNLHSVDIIWVADSFRKEHIDAVKYYNKIAKHGPKIHVLVTGEVKE